VLVRRGGVGGPHGRHRPPFGRVHRSGRLRGGCGRFAALVRRLRRQLSARPQPVVILAAGLVLATVRRRGRGFLSLLFLCGGGGGGSGGRGTHLVPVRPRSVPFPRGLLFYDRFRLRGRRRRRSRPSTRRRFLRAGGRRRGTGFEVFDTEPRSRTVAIFGFGFCPRVRRRRVGTRLR